MHQDTPRGRRNVILIVRYECTEPEQQHCAPDFYYLVFVR